MQQPEDGVTLVLHRHWLNLRDGKGFSWNESALMTGPKDSFQLIVSKPTNAGVANRLFPRDLKWKLQCPLVLGPLSIDR